MNYRSVSDLREDVREMAHELPSDIDLVVAIPRSGVLAANLLCLYLDVPMTDVDGLCRGDMFETGNRHEQSLSIDDIDTALVFDDSVYPGTQMAETRERVAGEDFPFDLEYGAAYVTENGLDQVDHWGKGRPQSAGVRVEYSPPFQPGELLRRHRRRSLSRPHRNGKR